MLLGTSISTNQTACKRQSKAWPLKRHRRLDLLHLLAWQAEQRLVQPLPVLREQPPLVPRLAKSELSRQWLDRPKLWPPLR